MNSPLVYVVPRIKIFSSRICEELLETEFSCIALPLPEEVEELLNVFLSKRKPFEEFLEEMLNILGLSEVYGKRYHYIKPIYNTLKSIKSIRKVNIVCYKSLDSELAEVNYLDKLLSLVARVIVSEKIDIESWKDFLLEVSEPLSEAVYEKLNLLSRSEAIIIVEYGNKHILRYMERAGARIVAPRGYIPIPLEVLIYVNMLLSEDEIIFLVKEYVRFIKEFLLKCHDIDEAYSLWASIRGKEIKDILLNLMKRANSSLELSSFEAPSSL